MGWESLIPVLTTLWSARQQKKAANKLGDTIKTATAEEAARLRELAAPGLEASQYAFPRLKSAITNMYGNVNKENPYLAAAHKMNVTGIQRGATKATSESTRYWQSMGNLGRSRGERLRISRGATEETGRENLAYGVGQQTYKDTNTARLIQALESLASLGGSSMAPAMGAAQTEAQGQISAAGVKAQASSDLWGDIGALGGTLYGSMEAKAEAERNRKWLELLLAGRK